MEETAGGVSGGDGAITRSGENTETVQQAAKVQEKLENQPYYFLFFLFFQEGPIEIKINVFFQRVLAKKSSHKHITHIINDSS